MELINGESVYQVGKQVANAEAYRLYLCSMNGMDRQCLLQTATDQVGNGKLERAAFILRSLAVRSEEVESEYEAVKTDPKDLLNYSLGFPEVIDSFVCKEQEGRRVNVLAFRNVEKVGQLIPLANLTHKDSLRIDLRTSVWIVGKLLKLLVFTHAENVAINLLSGNNILIEPELHYVLLFDWTAASNAAKRLPAKLRRQEIACIAQAALTALGRDKQSGHIPDDGEPAFGQYTNFLKELARGYESSAEKAHEAFYGLVDSLWKRGYHPFTTKPL